MINEKNMEVAMDKGFSDIFKWFSPLLRLLIGSQDSGSIDVGDIISALRGSGLESIEINPRSLYELIDAAILDKKIGRTPEADAFLNKIREEILKE